MKAELFFAGLFFVLQEFIKKVGDEQIQMPLSRTLFSLRKKGLLLTFAPALQMTLSLTFAWHTFAKQKYANQRFVHFRAILQVQVQIFDL